MRKIFRSLVIELSFVLALLICFTSACYAQKNFYCPLTSKKILGYEVPACGKDPESLAFSELTARDGFSGEIDFSKVIISKKEFEEKYLPKYINRFDNSKYGKCSSRLWFLTYEFRKQENVRLNDFDADLFIKEFMSKNPKNEIATMNDLLETMFIPKLFENTSSSIDSGECLISMDMDSESIIPTDSDTTSSDEMLALIDAHSTLITMSPIGSPDIGMNIKGVLDDTIFQPIKNENQTLTQIKEIYKQLLCELIFDEQVGNEIDRLSEGKTLGDTFKMDIEATKTLKKGVCRQFANRLISELYEIGVKAHNLIIINADGTSHIAVLYEVNKQNYVADLSREIQYCEAFPYFYNKSTPILNATPLENYIDMNKDAKSIAFCDEVLTDNQKTFFTANFVPLYSV